MLLLAVIGPVADFSQQVPLLSALHEYALQPEARKQRLQQSVGWLLGTLIISLPKIFVEVRVEIIVEHIKSYYHKNLGTLPIKFGAEKNRKTLDRFNIQGYCESGKILY